MKNRKSALRKAVMVAMLAGAITTTGGVKAEENFDFYNHVMQFL
ncbi:TPA: peptidase, partial [Streptococcus equi subsp. zooepidemicus]|nr:peptidase [Streptococcus equi subsp. zooepidemicus]